MGVFTPQMKSSMLRDRERGKRIEIDALSGATVRLGRRYGVPTPTNLIIYAALKAYDDRVAARGQPSRDGGDG
jgi:2-dehydropantoate 2-reductase